MNQHIDYHHPDSNHTEDNTSLPRKIIGIGETVLDIIFKNNQTIGAVPGGSTFNAIISLGRCGCQAVLLSEVGNDQPGNLVVDFMKDNGVCPDYMMRPYGMKTPISLAFLNERNDASYSFYKTETSESSDMPMPEVNKDDIVLFGSFYAINPMIRERVRKFIEYAKNCGAIIYYDVNYRPIHKPELHRLMPNVMENFEFADIVRGSSEDFDIIYDMKSGEDVYRSKLSFYTRNFIYTDSSNPVTVFGEGGFRKQYPTEKIETVSTIGAGDNFNAGLIFGLLKNNITLAQLQEGLSEDEWNSIITTAQGFSAECCKSIFNYVSKEFGGQQ